jgi:glycosyltransferase involved in cell wall biosynthesis
MTDPLDQVTPLILTYNEEANIGRTLAGLHWARRIVVVDSGSNDRTLELLAAWPQVEVIERPFDSHAQQWNHGLEQIPAGWVLSLDADYQVTPALLAEMQRVLLQSPTPAGFAICFRYCVFGRPLRGSVLPPRIALFQRQAGRYVDDGHTQDLVLSGSCGRLQEPLLHDDRKPLRRWLWAQDRYLRLEVEKLRTTPASQLGLADRLRRRKVLVPLVMPVFCLVFRGGVLDGWRGWFYAFQRTYVELLFSLMLIEADHAGAASGRLSRRSQAGQLPGSKS